MIQITSETKNQTFQLRDGWHLIFNGRVPPTEWQERGPAEAQLQLLESGYSILTPEGNIKHVGAELRIGKKVRFTKEQRTSGAHNREGVIVGIHGRLFNVRWTADGDFKEYAGSYSDWQLEVLP